MTVAPAFDPSVLSPQSILRARNHSSAAALLDRPEVSAWLATQRAGGLQ